MMRKKMQMNNIKHHIMKSFEKGQTKHRKVMPILHTYQINAIFLLRVRKDCLLWNL